MVSPKFQPALNAVDVGVADVGDLGEPLLQEGDRRLGRAAVHPRQQAEGEHVLGAGGVLAGQAELLDRLDRHPGQVERVHGERRRATSSLERVDGVAGLGQVAGGEVVGVHDDRRALGQVARGWPSARPGSSRPARRGRRPAVRMSWSAKCTWNDETPGSVPWGARISAGKFGSVNRSLPNAADSWVNRSPVSCMPSPESPANRMMTRSSCLTCLASPVVHFLVAPAVRPAVGLAFGGVPAAGGPRRRGRRRRSPTSDDSPRQVSRTVSRLALMDGDAADTSQADAQCGVTQVTRVVCSS